MMSKYIPIKSALARTKAIHKDKGKQILFDHIKTGTLRLRVKFKKVLESSTCYRFPLDEAKILLKGMPIKVIGQSELEDEIEALLENSPEDGNVSAESLLKVGAYRKKIFELREAHKKALEQQNELDKKAHALALTYEAHAADEKIYVYRGDSQIVIWVDISEVSEAHDSFLSFSCQNDYDKGVADYIAEMNLSPDFSELEIIRIQLFPHVRHKILSRYRYEDTLIITRARGLYCLKSDIEELFPRTRPESARKPGNQPLFDEAELKKLFVHLDAVFSDRASTPSRVAVSDAIQRYRDDPEGGPGKTALNDYANKYLEYRKKKSAK